MQMLYDYGFVNIAISEARVLEERYESILLRLHQLLLVRIEINLRIERMACLLDKAIHYLSPRGRFLAALLKPLLAEPEVVIIGVVFADLLRLYLKGRWIDESCRQFVASSLRIVVSDYVTVQVGILKMKLFVLLQIDSVAR